MTDRRRALNPIERKLEDFARSKVGGWYFLNVAMRVDRVLLPLTRGRISSAPGQQVLLLETVGAKSGERRRTPLVYVTDGSHIVLIASKAGAKRHPAWLHNLRANPRVKVLGPGRSGDYIAREAEGDERGRLWREAVDYYAGYETYQDRAGERRIPVVVLEPAP
jgi:deazaflavin-dependent oxidoreductase (nitroreductase family)